MAFSFAFSLSLIWAAGGVAQMPSEGSPPQEGEQIVPTETVKPSEAPAETESADEAYRIGEDDLLNVQVFDEPDLSQAFRVSREGFIDFPVLGPVRVLGMSPGQVSKKLEELLAKDLLVNPRVSVSVQEFKNNKVVILGAVLRPGSYPIEGRATLVDALSWAGGLNLDEAGYTLILRRPSLADDGSSLEEKTFRIDLEELLEEGNPEMNMRVRNQDTIYIPPGELVSIFGEVKQPGAYRILKKNFTVTDLIARAGGLTEVAAENRTRVVRKEGDRSQVFQVPVTDIKRGKGQNLVLKGGDIVVIPQTIF